jgi:hypothetical protein
MKRNLIKLCFGQVLLLNVNNWYFSEMNSLLQGKLFTAQIIGFIKIYCNVYMYFFFSCFKSVIKNFPYRCFLDISNLLIRKILKKISFQMLKG